MIQPTPQNKSSEVVGREVAVSLHLSHPLKSQRFNIFPKAGQNPMMAEKSTTIDYRGKTGSLHNFFVRIVFLGFPISVNRRFNPSVPGADIA